MAESETVSLIGSDKVQGTAVYGPDGDRIGAIERVMIEKTTGRVSYAVLSFGGFLGIGDDEYPLPWPSLKYNVELGRLSNHDHQRPDRRRAQKRAQWRMELGQ